MSSELLRSDKPVLKAGISGTGSSGGGELVEGCCIIVQWFRVDCISMSLYSQCQLSFQKCGVLALKLCYDIMTTILNGNGFPDNVIIIGLAQENSGSRNI